MPAGVVPAAADVEPGECPHAARPSTAGPTCNQRMAALRLHRLFATAAMGHIKRAGMVSALYPVKTMSFIKSMGLVAALLTTFAFLPQVLQTLRSRSTGGLNLPMLVVLTAGIVLWLVYGLGTGQLPVILANGATLLLVAIAPGLKLRDLSPRALISPRGRAAGARRRGSRRGTVEGSGRPGRRRARPRRPCSPSMMWVRSGGTGSAVSIAEACGCRSSGQRGIPDPERRAAAAAELPLARALGIALVVQDGVEGADVLRALDLQARRLGAEVDGEAAAAGGLAADRAVAEHEGIGVRRLHAEAHGAAVAGSFEVHGRLTPAAAGRCRRAR